VLVSNSSYAACFFPPDSKKRGDCKVRRVSKGAVFIDVLEVVARGTAWEDVGEGEGAAQLKHAIDNQQSAGILELKTFMGRSPAKKGLGDVRIGNELVVGWAPSYHNNSGAGTTLWEQIAYRYLFEHADGLESLVTRRTPFCWYSTFNLCTTDSCSFRWQKWVKYSELFNGF
jgi:hypothetical protein